MAATGFEPATNNIAFIDSEKINELGVLSSAHLSSNKKQVLSARSYFTVAIAAIYRSVLAWLEWYFGFLTTIGTYCREHLAGGTIAVSATAIAVTGVSVPLCFSGLTAFRATFGLVGIASGFE